VAILDLGKTFRRGQINIQLSNKEPKKHRQSEMECSHVVHLPQLAQANLTGTTLQCSSGSGRKYFWSLSDTLIRVKHESRLTVANFDGQTRRSCAAVRSNSAN
jgi:hypothetical protein